LGSGLGLVREMIEGANDGRSKGIEAWVGEFEQWFQFPWDYFSLPNSFHAIHLLKQAN
jgi:hypothetical protein